MSYKALARKWRPKRFTDVIGQKLVITALSNALQTNKVHHAYLFSGTRGVGKTSIARLFAKGLNCQQGVTAEPCGVCDNCQEIEQGRFIDLLEIDAASRTKVEDTREILDNVQYMPNRGRYKVYLIDEVHMLSRSSFNALLKTLEEPPEYVKFLLATTEPQKLPITILSRCLHFHLSALSHDLIIHQLEEILTVEQLDFEQRALQLLAKSADGSMRDALSLTEQAIAMGEGHISAQVVTQMLGMLDDEHGLLLIEALSHSDAAQIMHQLQLATYYGVNWDQLLSECLSLLHQVAMMQLLPDAVGPYRHHVGRMQYLAQKITPEDLQLYYQIILNSRKELPYAPEPRIGVEMAFLRALAFVPRTMSVSRITQAQTLKTPDQHQLVQQHKLDESVKPLFTEKKVHEQRTELPPTTAKLLANRQRLQQLEQSIKKSEAVMTEQPRLAKASGLLQKWVTNAETKPKAVKKEGPSSGISGENSGSDNYRWRAKVKEEQTSSTITPQVLKQAVEHEKTPELNVQLIEESQQRDRWAAEVEALILPRLTKQLALNAFKEQPNEKQIFLHLRSSKWHLNTDEARHALTNALSDYYHKPIEVMVVKDDDIQNKTPLEWRQIIYEEKLANAKQSIASDKIVQQLCHLFAAKVDEESIRPV